MDRFEPTDIGTRAGPGRVLGRSGVRLRPILWQMGTGMSDGEMLYRVVREAVAAGANGFLLDADMAEEQVERLVAAVGEANADWIVGVRAEELLGRHSRWFERRLGLLRQSSCEVVMLEGAAITQIKAGRPFHRLGQLRDAGKIRAIVVEAEDVAMAEWVVEHTPAHGVCVSFGVEDMSAKYRMMTAAKELGVGVLARQPMKTVWNLPAMSRGQCISAMVGEEDVAAVVERLPASEEELSQVLEGVRHPMERAQRDQLWHEFAAVVAPPVKHRSGHAPDEI